jgi:hypothetical protein
VNFSKGNFTGYNFQIRGIGSKLVSGSGDAGTGIHLNNAPLIANNLFETEFYDVERVEVLRGPQGTLYGRNATGGVVNLLTAKPDRHFAGNLRGRVRQLQRHEGARDDQHPARRPVRRALRRHLSEARRLREEPDHRQRRRRPRPVRRARHPGLPPDGQVPRLGDVGSLRGRRQPLADRQADLLQGPGPGQRRRRRLLSPRPAA